MNTVEKTLARMRFQTITAKVMGMEFQNIFTRIMSYATPDFSPVKPQGKQGDWKNDGHEPKAGRYYQVYAPEIFDEAGAVNKIEVDFNGLVKKWGDTDVYPIGIKEFYFVINDAYRVNPGAYPTTYKKLEDLRLAYSLDECKPFLNKDLEEKLLALADDQILSIVGFLPNPADIKVLRFDLLSEVIGHIINNPISRSLDNTLASPEFEEKIEFNRLNYTGDWLKSADFRRGAVEKFFNSNSEFARQDVRDKLKAMYNASKAMDFADIPGGPTKEDQQFESILAQIAPSAADITARQHKDLEDAALVVMAYFFEACDLFEEPTQC
ncbi:MAG: hypothetical protein Q7T65_06730 [Thiobacillus sp.]|nr:hypothetical protein [Thiobacillus sp.]